MNAAHRKLNRWFSEEMKALIAQGATPEDIQEEAFAKLLGNKVMDRHRDEVLTDPELRKILILEAITNASPQELRGYAALYRAKGDAELAYDIETFADQQQRAS
jgi:hypothetical protein